jgi:hypothetical protein
LDRETRRPARMKIVDLPKPPRGIGRRWNMRCRGGSSRVRGNPVRRWLRQPDADIHFQMFLRALWAEGFAGVFVTQAGQFIAAVDAVAISRCRSRLDRYERHWFCPFPQDSTSTTPFSQGAKQNGREERSQTCAAAARPLSSGTAGTVCQHSRATRSTMSPAWS